MSSPHLDPDRRVAVSGFTALPTGTRVDRYEIESLIAAGGFGVTYIARHVVLDKRVALKEHFPRDFAQRDGATLSLRPTNPETFEWTKDRFIREGRTLTECRHPSVVEVTDVFEANGTAYMALGYVEGDSLGRWLKSLGRAPSQVELDRLLTPLLDALAFVHSRDLLHRDLAPDNIIIRPDGTPVLIDFGAARQAVAQRSMMMSAIVKGGYSPPEQYTSKGQTQGPWSDIYALGATLHYLLTGQAVEESTARTAEDSYRPLAETLGARASDYRSAFLSAIDQALRLTRLDRPQTIESWREGLFGPGVAGPPPAPVAEPIVDKPGAGLSSLPTELVLTSPVLATGAAASGSGDALPASLADGARASGHGLSDRVVPLAPQASAAPRRPVNWLVTVAVLALVPVLYFSIRGWDDPPTPSPAVPPSPLAPANSSQSDQFARQLNDREVCVAALTRDRNAWETAAFFQAYRREVERRGLDIARCRSLAR